MYANERPVANKPLYSLFNTFLNENSKSAFTHPLNLGKNGGAVNDHFKY